MSYESIGKSFVQQYYNAFDVNRANLQMLYRDQSMLTFEGTPCQGPDSIVKKLMELTFKTIKHIITTTDVQPTEGGVLVFVIGQLKTDDDPPMTFSEIFHLRQADPSTYFIFNQIFRLSLHHN
ncbi:Nuclear transport factor 2 [Trichoplax sp. H2]|nr:Nuclear transport factor 2 [Trichoplax sp. H2]|eukprot:RDD47436.1 Nuclear transport factor 2 [Trichoplax sp. H2]